MTKQLSSSARSRDTASRILPVCIFLVVLSVVLEALLAGCSAFATAPSAARHTPVPPVQAAGPVEVTVAVVQQGSLATHDARLSIAVTIANHTSAPIAIARIGCHYKAIALELYDSNGVSLWQNDVEYVACPLEAGRPQDVWNIGAQSSILQFESADLFGPASTSNVWQPPATPASLDASKTYTLIARVRKWHQGTVDDIGRPDIPQGDYVPGQTTIHFQ